jgi:serine/threonine-protein kinase
MAADPGPLNGSDTPSLPTDNPAERPTIAPETLIPSANPSPPPAAGLPPSRYQPIQFHAAGNLGEVLLAKDPELNRAVALKRIQERHADNPESRRRFLREAEITGRLEHPGVVPVYGLGQDPDGHPCYAMRFIQGESLKDAIERFHAQEKPGRDPGERRLALRQLLTSFVAVCKTMAYAHSRGVLHRDLKPANIMLGKYGETLVVDWGLARTFERDEVTRSHGEASLQPGLDGAGSETQVGAMLGTPAYASPEQAAGHWDLVGPASDIFSLGATLYNLLTNASPYQGEAVQEIIAQASMGEVIPPRQRKKDVPRALEAICLKAMAKRRQERYATALDLAADVEHWLADEPVAAHRESLFERLARIGKRRRSAVVAGGALLLAALALAASLVLAHARTVAEKERKIAQEERTTAEGERELARRARDQEKIAREAAENALEEADRQRQARQELEVRLNNARVASGLNLMNMLLAGDPANKKLRLSRAEAHAALAHWAEAAADFAKAQEGEPNLQLAGWHAACLAAAGDWGAHRKACAALLEQFGKNPDHANELAWYCVRFRTGPGDVIRPLKLAEQAVEAETDPGAFSTLGAAQYRAARYTDFIDMFEKAIQIHYKDHPSDTLFLALCHHRLGHADEAKKWLTRAQQWINQAPKVGDEALPWDQRLELELLRAEAEEAILSRK